MVWRLAAANDASNSRPQSSCAATDERPRNVHVQLDYCSAGQVSDTMLKLHQHVSETSAEYWIVCSLQTSHTISLIIAPCSSPNRHLRIGGISVQNRHHFSTHVDARVTLLPSRPEATPQRNDRHNEIILAFQTPYHTQSHIIQAAYQNIR
jgi:hypothetical protein